MARKRSRGHAPESFENDTFSTGMSDDIVKLDRRYCGLENLAGLQGSGPGPGLGHAFLNFFENGNTLGRRRPPDSSCREGEKFVILIYSCSPSCIFLTYLRRLNGDYFAVSSAFRSGVVVR